MESIEMLLLGCPRAYNRRGRTMRNQSRDSSQLLWQRKEKQHQRKSAANRAFPPELYGEGGMHVGAHLHVILSKEKSPTVRRFFLW